MSATPAALPHDRSIRIPGPVWWDLAAIAEARHTTVEQEIERALLVAIGDARPALTFDDEVWQHWAQHMPDREIAKAMNATNEAIARSRRRLGLLPHRKPRTE